eukprot:scaffold79094_cov35-Cyclotella_meneghiniana.AAC.4
MMHFFGCDVYNSPLDNSPNQYYLWESDLTSQFSDKTNPLSFHQSPTKPAYHIIHTSLPTCPSNKAALDFNIPV